jgi:hypothetical protein
VAYYSANTVSVIYEETDREGRLARVNIQEMHTASSLKSLLKVQAYAQVEE